VRCLFWPVASSSSWRLGFLEVVGGVFVASGVTYGCLRVWRRLVSVLESGLGLRTRRGIYRGELG
jgi:hypothetical protein